MADLELETVDELARFLGAERSQVSNWLNGYNLPPVRWMDILCAKRPGFNLDWLYRGIADAVPTALAIKLEALAQGMSVPLCNRPPKSPAKSRSGAQRAGQTRKGRNRAI